jgi:hypothetical protein
MESRPVSFLAMRRTIECLSDASAIPSASSSSLSIAHASASSPSSSSSLLLLFPLPPPLLSSLLLPEASWASDSMPT